MSKDRAQHTLKKGSLPLLLIGISFFLVHFSGDHVFNKTNSLKLILLAISVSILFPLSIVTYLKRWNFEKQQPFLIVFFLLFLPIIATLPGAIIHQGKYSYALPLELASQFACIIWACWIFYFSRNLNSIKYLLIPISLTIIWISFIGYVEKLGLEPLTRLNINFFERSWQEGSHIAYINQKSRIESTFGNINYFAGFLILLVPVFLSLLISELVCSSSNKKKSELLSKNVSFTVLVLLIIALMFTETRAAIVGLIFSLVIFFILYFHWLNRPSAPQRTFHLALILMLVTGTLLLVGSHDRFYSLIISQEWIARTMSWEAAWDSVKSAPLLGYGIGSSYELFFNFVNKESRLFVSNRSYNHVHSEWLEIIQEGGIFGLIVHLLSWCLIFYLGIKNIKQPNGKFESRLLSLGLVCGLLAYHFHGLFSVAPRMVSTRMTAYTLVAFILVIAFKENKLIINRITQTKTLYRKGWHCTFLSVLIMLLLMFILLWSWLIPFAIDQYKYAYAVAHDQQKSHRSLELSQETNDVYALNMLVINAARNKNAEHLKYNLERLHNIFPNYREIGYYQAYLKYLEQDWKQAKEKAFEQQKKDLYHLNTTKLLTNIAIRQNDMTQFKRQIQVISRLFACKQAMINCNQDTVSAHEKKLEQPVQFTKLEDALEITIDSDFIRVLYQKVLNQNRARSSNITKLSLKFAQILARDSFFNPFITNINKNKSTEETYKMLARHSDLERQLITLNNNFIQKLKSASNLPLWQQITNHYKEKSKLEFRVSQLEKERQALVMQLALSIDLAEFQKRRKFLHFFSNWLASSVLFE